MLRSVLSVVLCMAVLMAGSHKAQAGIVTNKSLAQNARVDLDRQDILNLLSRSEAKQQLMVMGVDPAMVHERVRYMTDAEVLQVNQKLDEMYAGQADILGLLVLLFIIFIVTDMLGATNIFPFVSCVTC